MMSDSEEIVLVRVKSASHPSCEDVEFSCDPKAMSVRQVKEKIRTLYSFHPDIADQRLIYAGHLLDDLQLLTDVFGLSGAGGSFASQTSYQHSGPYTIHLACTSKSYVSPSQRSTRNDNPADSSSQTPLYSSQIPNPMMQDPRMTSQPDHFDGSSGVPPEFYALHQLYVEQMSSYMRTWNLAYGIRNLGVGSPPGNVPHFHNMNIPPGNLPNNIPNDNAGPGNVPPGQPQQPAPNAAQQQNDRGRQAGGGNFGGLGGIIAGGNDDDENQRDLLDWAYTLSRVILILSVVYFYSSFARFLLVVAFTLAIALFQRRPARNQEAQNRGVANERQGNNNNNPLNPAGAAAAAEEENRNEARPNGDNPDTEPEPAANNVDDNGANANNNDDPVSNSGDNAEGEAAEANIAAGGADGQHRFAYYRDVTWTFLTTFFTSLIPEMPQHN